MKASVKMVAERKLGQAKRRRGVSISDGGKAAMAHGGRVRETAHMCLFTWLPADSGTRVTRRHLDET